MQRTRLDDDTVNRLAALPVDGHPVLSVYVDLDPAAFPHVRDRRAEVDSILDDVQRRFVDGDGVDRERRAELRDDLERLAAFLTDEELAASGRGLALFCCEGADIFEVLTLPRAVDSIGVVAPRAFIEPLVELGPAERWCVLLVSRRAARILRGTRDRLLEVGALVDDVHGRHAQGGWSQARFQRSIEHDVDAHIRSACALLAERHRRRSFDRLLVGGPSELHQRVERELRPELRERLAGFLEIDVERATAEDVRRRAAPAIEASETAHENDVLGQLREGLAPGGHAASGLDEVLELLNERRVRTLLLAADAPAPGFACPKCARLSAAAGTCPVDGAELRALDDALEAAAEAALAQDAEVVVVRHRREELTAHGPVAALVRW